MRALIAACTGAPVIALAQAHGIELHGISRHSPSGHYCETNPGAAYWRDIGEVKAYAGIFRNSFCGTSAYVSAEYDLARYRRLSAGIGVGLASGYAHWIEPAAWLYAHVPIAPSVYIIPRYVPRIAGISDRIYTLSIGINF
jgi:hypothetical protein